MLNRETIAGNILKFAQDNKLKIYPGQEPLKWADLLIKRGVTALAYETGTTAPVILY